MRHSSGIARREFLAATVAGTSALASGCAVFGTRKREIIDCHTHFYDPTRPQGVPWPGRNETQLYRRVLPGDYKKLAVPLGITGTVVVEASAWLEDNQWVLDLAKDEPFIKGFVGHLNAGEAGFAPQVNRFAHNPLFRGIRVSFGDVPKLNEPTKLRDLQVLADHDLSLDVNGGVDSLPTVATVAKSVPQLRIIINHVSNVRINGREPPRDWQEGMRRAAAHPNVFCKVSGLVEGTGQRGNVPHDVGFYRPILDHVWNCFGEDRVIYGSNWPVSELFADLATVHGMAKNYFGEKGERAAQKYFADNALGFYKWTR
jgi:L-fuconolactonase